MALDRRNVLPAQSVKRKFYQWFLKTYQDDSFAEYSQANPAIPDVADIAGMLRSSGFRLKGVDLVGADTTGAAAKGCKVTMQCATSGLKVTLESEANCRCPEAARDNSATVWSVTSLSGSQESLNKGDQAGSSVLPEIPAAVTEVVGATTKCVMRLLDDAATNPLPTPPPTSPKPSLLHLNPRPSGRCISMGSLPGANDHKGLKNQLLAGPLSGSLDRWDDQTFALAGVFGNPASGEVLIRRHSSSTEEHKEFKMGIGDSIVYRSKMNLRGEDSGSLAEEVFLPDEKENNAQSGISDEKFPDRINPQDMTGVQEAAHEMRCKTEGAIKNMNSVLEYLKQLINKEVYPPAKRPNTTTERKSASTLTSRSQPIGKSDKRPQATLSKTYSTPRLGSLLAGGRPSDPGPIASRPRASSTASHRSPANPPGGLLGAAATLRRRLAINRGRGTAESTNQRQNIRR